MNALEREYDRFESSIRSNPSEGDDLSRFVRYLSAEEKLGSFRQGDWVEFGRARGMNDDQIGVMLESTATWIVDEKIPVSDQAPADWPEDVSVLKGQRTVVVANPQKSARRGTQEFDDLMDEVEREWELDDDELDNIVEVRRCGDSFEIRLKGEDEWELLEDEDDDEDSGEEE